MKNNQNIINQRIKEFVYKYYLNQLYKGGIFFVAISLVVFIGYTLFEYFSFFNSAIRLFLLLSYLLLFTATFIFYIIMPLLKIGGIGKVLTREQIARIIGIHFPEIDDKLLNYLQLKKQQNETNNDLIIAAIEQKEINLRPIPFIIS
jgi:hypothetical protein